MSQPIRTKRNRTLTRQVVPETIGFRLLDDADRQLLQQAALQAGASVHDLARDYVIHALHSGGTISELHAIREDITNARQEIATVYLELEELRRDLRAITAAVLVSAGKTPLEDAKRWVLENLKKD